MKYSIPKSKKSFGGSNSTMAYQSTFKQRLEDMDIARNHRLSILQDEKETQKSKSLLLSAKHAKIRLLEQRCLILDHKLASHNFKISSLKSEIEFLDRKFQTCAQQLRELKVEVDALEDLEKEREFFYSLKCSQMNGFKKESEKYAEKIGSRVTELRSFKDKKNSYFRELSSKAENNDVEAAQMRKSELLALKEKIVCSLEANKQERTRLQGQLQSLR